MASGHQDELFKGEDTQTEGIYRGWSSRRSVGERPGWAGSDGQRGEVGWAAPFGHAHSQNVRDWSYRQLWVVSDGGSSADTIDLLTKPWHMMIFSGKGSSNQAQGVCFVGGRHRQGPHLQHWLSQNWCFQVLACLKTNTTARDFTFFTLEAHPTHLDSLTWGHLPSGSRWMSSVSLSPWKGRLCPTSKHRNWEWESWWQGKDWLLTNLQIVDSLLWIASTC